MIATFSLYVNKLENEIAVYYNKHKYLFSWYDCEIVDTDNGVLEIRSLYADKLHEVVSILAKNDVEIVEVIE